ncbi:MAG: acyl-CoA dehydrogenase [Patescibacteria group bacterium]
MFLRLRQKLITRFIFKLYKKMMPPLSKTEKEVLESGTVWWEGELFSGQPNWNKLLALAWPKLTIEETGFLDGPVNELCRMLDDWKINYEVHDLPPEVWKFIKEKNFWGVIIPKEYGGLGFSHYAHSQIIAKIASRSLTASITVMVPNSLGPAELLINYGSAEQKNHYLPKLAKGEEIPCFALTETEAGSDASSLKSFGIICRQEFNGKETLGIKLNWSKRYITLGPVATLIGLAFKLFDPENILTNKKDLGITFALVPTNLSGITIGRRHIVTGTSFQTGPNSGKDVFIPLDYVIGGKDRIGQGWKMLMECLSVGRAISLPATSIGMMNLACRAAGAYARTRRQFKLPLGKFEGIAEVLGQMGGNLYAADAARTLVASALEEGAKPSVISAILKYNLTEMARKTVNQALDIFGGKGVVLGPKNILGLVYQSIPKGITVEGANILTRSLIIFGQGMIRAHPYIKEEMKAIVNPEQSRGLKDFDKAFFAHLGFVVKNAVRTLFYGLTNGRFIKAPAVSRPEKRYYRGISRLSAVFAFVSDVSAFILRGNLKKMESLTGRLADILSEMYLVSAALKRFSNDGRKKEDLPFLLFYGDSALYKIQETLYGIFGNFPVPFVGWLLKTAVFPLGRNFAPASDKMKFKIAEILTGSSWQRDRLLSDIYIPSDSEEPLKQLETALAAAEAAEPIEKRIREAQKNKVLKSDDIKEARAIRIISKGELKILEKADELRKTVVEVDDFKF